ncbi:serine hydrolase domain-containing protein [Pseudofulvibacter geojedonensis]|uniref:Serine hydrolase domain-containing protein n=1 Tax=Pseudofulvibacter geojedonensis TaxID=1123758 RepID=A0ABW3I549_9FLAO
MKKIIFIFLISSFCLLTAQEINTKKLDSIFDRVAELDKGMASVSVFKDGKEVYQKSYGFVDVNNQIKSNATTKYKIGSISKTYTSVLILKAVEEGKLSLNTKLEKYYPELPNADKITIKQLLNHSSGLFNYTSKDDFMSWILDGVTKKELLTKFKENGTVFEPGEKNEYSNTNYVLLAYILEKIYDKPFKEVLYSKVLAKLKLKNTYHEVETKPEDNEAFSFTKEGKKWIKAPGWKMENAIGAGSLVATATDVNIFMDGLFTNNIINQASLEEMKTMTNDFGLGLFSYPYGNKWLYGHTGGIEAFTSMTGYLPEENLSFTICSNAVGVDNKDLAIAILANYFNDNYIISSLEPETNYLPENITQYEGLYSTESFPLKIKIFVKGDVLMAQATGQGAFPLTPVELHKFKFDAAGIKFIFNPNEKMLSFTQMGNSFDMKKE